MLPARLQPALTCLLLVVLDPRPAPAAIQFVDATTSAGLGTYRATSGDDHGPGAVFADLDNDGFPDLYLVQSGVPNLLYRNTDAGGGARTFVLEPGAAGAGDPSLSNGAIAGDVDNDGDLDLYVINWDQPNVLYQNQLMETGGLAFVDVTASTDPTPGVADNQYGVGIAYENGVPLDNSLTAAFSDVDRDGDLDLFVGNHNSWYTNIIPPEGPDLRPGRRDVFYLNDGDGRFTEATTTYGVQGYETVGGGFETGNQKYSSTNAAIFADFDNDRWPDLLVTNKVGGPDDVDMLYRNLGADTAGTWLGFECVTYTMPRIFGNRSGGAMGVDVGDPDNDGDLDIYITDWSLLDPLGPGWNDFYRNQWSETGELSFIASSSLMPALFSWGTVWQDFDNDGFQDVYVGVQFPERDFLYRTDPVAGPVEMAQTAGVAQTGDSRGVVAADYNRDGWSDVFVVRLWTTPSLLYENTSHALGTGNRYLVVELVGDPQSPAAWASSKDALGARAILAADLDGDGEVQPGEVQIREVVSGSSNAASTSSLALEFGVGQANAATLEILWPSGQNTLHALGVNSFQTIREADAGVAVQLLTDRSFERGGGGWTTEEGGSANASFSIDSATASHGLQSLRTDILSVDGVAENVRFYLGDLPVLGGRSYEVRFDARASTPGALRSTVARDHDPFDSLGHESTVTLGTTWQTFQHVFVANDTDPDARWAIELGMAGPRTVWVDHVSLRLLPAATAAPDPGGESRVLWVSPLSPNPAQSVTSFRVEAGAPEPVTLRVFDLRGRAVGVERQLRAQQPRQFLWDGRDDAGRRLPSGVYFLQFTAGGRQEVRRLTLLR